MKSFIKARVNVNSLYHLLNMSSNKPSFRKKGKNCNKLWRIQRDNDRQVHTSSAGPTNSAKSNVLKNTNDASVRPPHGLKGKALGLWYRDRNRNREEKPVTVSLNAERQEEIQNLLDALGVPKQFEGMQKGTFKQRFLEKINTVFEEKLEQTNIVRLKNDVELDEELYHELIKKKSHSKEYQKMLEFRQKLPSYKSRKDLLNLISNNQVIVISGETGVVHR